MITPIIPISRPSTGIFCPERRILPQPPQRPVHRLDADVETLPDPGKGLGLRQHQVEVDQLLRWRPFHARVSDKKNGFSVPSYHAR